MAQVFIPALLTSHTGGLTTLEIPGETLREIVSTLVARYPSLHTQFLDEQHRLRSGLAIAVDGEIGTEGLREIVGPDAEIHFVMAIKGGS